MLSNGGELPPSPSPDNLKFKNMGRVKAWKTTAKTMSRFPRRAKTNLLSHSLKEW